MLLPNGMAFPHSHAGAGAGHDPFHGHGPHVHLGWLFRHDHDEIQDDDGDEHDEAGEPAAPTPANHDDDALDLAGPMIATVRPADNHDADLRATPAQTLVDIALSPAPSPTAFVPRPHPPPGRCAQDCPIYLSTLSLLI
jgi:hypothetical protein